MTRVAGERLLKIGQAAKLLNLSVATLRNWGERGVLLPVRLPGSGHRMYRVEDVEALIGKPLAKEGGPAEAKPAGRQDVPAAAENSSDGSQPPPAAQRPADESAEDPSPLQ